VQDYIASLGFPEYQNLIAEAQIDGPKLLRLTTDDLRQEPLQIVSPDHVLVIHMQIGELKMRHQIFSAAERAAHRAAHPSLDGWSATDVRAYLEAMGLVRYAERFAEAAVDGEVLRAMDDAQLERLLELPGEEGDVATRQADLGFLSAQLSMLRARAAV
jgi:hypothetical protein